MTNADGGLNALEIVRMGLERRERIAAIWADAFWADPLMNWLFADDNTRRASLLRWWDFTLGHLPSGAELHGSRADGCVAYWQPPRRSLHAPSEPEKADAGESEGRPDQSDHGESEGHRAFAAMMAELVGDEAPARMEMLGRIHQHRLPDPHWYLAVLGTTPDQQGRGLGGKVLAPMLERCDRTATVAYLESSNPANIAFYRRHGFETTGELVLDDTVLVTLMTRTPRPPQS